MLETLVAPRIRRTLFEYLLVHPSDRFYLRGLAKDLGLPISPLRRELKRLMGAGMLHAAQEGNILFYTVKTTSPAFLQLQQAGEPLRSVGSAQSAVLPEPSAADNLPHEEALGFAGSGSEVSTPRERMTSKPAETVGRSALATPLLLAISLVGMALMLIVAGLSYVSMINPHRTATFRVLSKRAEVMRPNASSGVMRGSRWQVTPGGVGGFTSSSNSEPRTIR